MTRQFTGIAGLVLVINLAFYAFVIWLILSLAVMVIRPFTDNGCAQEWGIDSAVVLEKSFCPVDKTVGE